MTQPQFTMRELVEAGVHFGHKTKRWNPAMAPYIYGVRNDTHIIDLGQTAPMLHQALAAVRDVASKNGKILFVGTKRQASQTIAEAARSCEQYYINQRWLGGLLTNWNTIQASIQRLKKLEETLGGEHVGLTKKELLGLERQRQKLENSLGGIKDMGTPPDLIFIIDTNKEELAVQEAKKLNIPTVAIVDTNATVSSITYPIPGNDDALRAIHLYCQLIADTIKEARKHLPAQAAPILSPAAKKQLEEEKKAKAAKAKEEAEKEEKAVKSTTKKAALAETKKAVEDAKEAAPESSEEKPAKAKEEKAEEKPKAAAKKAPSKKTAAKKAETDKKEEKEPAAKKAPAKKTTAKKTAEKSDDKAEKTEAKKEDSKKSKTVKKAS